MNDYSRHNSHEQPYASNQQVMASCYGPRPAPDYIYYTNPYGVMHHPINTLTPQYAAGYGKQDPAAIQGTDIRPTLGTASPLYQPSFVHDPFRYQRRKRVSNHRFLL